MPAEQRGSVRRTGYGWELRWYEGGRRRSKSGFASKTAAHAYFRGDVRPRLERRLAPGMQPDVLTFDALCDAYLLAHAPGREASTMRTLRDRLKRPRSAFGTSTLTDLEASAPQIAAWRATLPAGSAAAIMGAFRQVLDQAIAWDVITKNPARLAGRVPQPKRAEVSPFTRKEIDTLAVELGPSGLLVTFAAETGLRPGEWAAIEWRDVDRNARILNVQRSYTFPGQADPGGVKRYTKTTRRHVPLNTRAMDALDAVARRIDTPLVFPAPRGGYFDLHNWRAREWIPALEAAGIPRRRVYDLRHTYATLALAAGIQTFELSRYMGTSLRMIDDTYGHLSGTAAAAAAALMDAHIASGG